MYLKKKSNLYQLVLALLIPCNFAMRGDDSDEEEKIQRQLAELSMPLSKITDKKNEISDDNRSEEGSIGSRGSAVSVVSKEEVETDLNGHTIIRQTQSYCLYIVEKMFLYINTKMSSTINGELEQQLRRNIEDFLTKRKDINIPVGYFVCNIIMARYSTAIDPQSVEKIVYQSFEKVRTLLNDIIASYIKNIQEGQMPVLRHETQTLYLHFLFNFMYIDKQKKETILNGVKSATEIEQVNNISPANYKDPTSQTPNMLTYQMAIVNNKIVCEMDKKKNPVMAPIEGYIPYIDHGSLIQLFDYSGNLNSKLSLMANKLQDKYPEEGKIFPTDYLNGWYLTWATVISNFVNHDKQVETNCTIYVNPNSKSFLKLKNMHSRLDKFCEAHLLQPDNYSVKYDNNNWFTLRFNPRVIDVMPIKMKSNKDPSFQQNLKIRPATKKGAMTSEPLANEIRLFLPKENKFRIVEMSSK